MRREWYYLEYASASPLTIGMSVDEFKELTGVSPYDCAFCKKGELFAQVHQNKLGMASDGEFEVMFKNNKLIMISMSPAIHDLGVITKNYDAIFHKIPEVRKLNLASSISRWSGDGIVIEVTYGVRDSYVSVITIMSNEVKH